MPGMNSLHRQGTVVARDLVIAGNAGTIERHTRQIEDGHNRMAHNLPHKPVLRKNGERRGRDPKKSSDAGDFRHDFSLGEGREHES